MRAALVILLLASCAGGPEECAAFSPARGRSAGHAFCHNGICFPQLPVMVVDPDDAPGADKSNVMSTWTSFGTTIVPETADAAHTPMLLKSMNNGHAGLAFDGTADDVTLSGSASSLAFVASTLTFDIFVILQYDFMNQAWYLITDSQANTTRGFTIGTSNTGQPWFFIADGLGHYHVNKTATAAYSNAVWHVVEFRGDGVNYKMAIDGGAYETTAFATTPSAGNLANDLAIARDFPTGSNYANETLGYFVAFNTALSAGDVTTLLSQLGARLNTMPVKPPIRLADLGDSITQGGHADNPFTAQIQADHNATNHGTIATGNFGKLSDTTTGMLNRWRSDIKTRGFTHLGILGCVNDLINAADNAGAQTTAEALCETNINTIITEARADTSGAPGGIEICLSNLTPWATSAFSSTNRQNATATFSTYVAGKAGPHIGVIDANGDTNLGNGSPSALLVGKDSGDHLHPNQAGATVQAGEFETCFGL